MVAVYLLLTLQEAAPPTHTPWTPWLVLAGALILMAAFVSVRWRRRRRVVWRHFAVRHDLAYEPDVPRVQGRVDGHVVRLAVAGESSDVGELGAESELLTLSLEAAPPADLEVLTAPGISGEVERALEHQDLATGDERFDQRVVVRAREAERALAWLTPTRRAALLRLAERDPGDVAGVRGGELFVEGRVLRPELERLEQWLGALRDTARDLHPRA